MTALTLEQFAQAMAGVKLTLLQEPPRDLVPDGAVVVWPSCTADYEDQGRHIEALVFEGTQSKSVLVMVSKRVFAVLEGQ